MKNKLKQLFDYQSFAGNARLEQMAADADAHAGTALSDADLADVNAAGEIEDIRSKRAEQNLDTEHQLDNG